METIINKWLSRLSGVDPERIETLDHTTQHQFSTLGALVFFGCFLTGSFAGAGLAYAFDSLLVGLLAGTFGFILPLLVDRSFINATKQLTRISKCLRASMLLGFALLAIICAEPLLHHQTIVGHELKKFTAIKKIEKEALLRQRSINADSIDSYQRHLTTLAKEDADFRKRMDNEITGKNGRPSGPGKIYRHDTAAYNHFEEVVYPRRKAELAARYTPFIQEENRLNKALYELEESTLDTSALGPATQLEALFELVMAGDVGVIVWGLVLLLVLVPADLAAIAYKGRMNFEVYARGVNHDNVLSGAALEKAARANELQDIKDIELIASAFQQEIVVSKIMRSREEQVKVTAAMLKSAVTDFSNYESSIRELNQRFESLIAVAPEDQYPLIHEAGKHALQELHRIYLEASSGLTTVAN